jgi:hypothetical protein
MFQAAWRAYRSLQPKQVFRIDTAGALLTALLIGFLLAGAEPVFGMPRTICLLLAALAIIFALYSFTCSVWAGKRWPLLLKIIAIANSCYIIITAAFAGYHYHQLTFIGWAYFAGEALIVGLLAHFEWRRANLAAQADHL